jgi:type IV pilus assembly protein PilC
VLERTHALRNRLRAALAYPAIVALTASLLIVFLLVRVIPMFAGLFAGFGVPLPAPTRLLLGAGAALSSPLTWCAAAAVAALVVVVVAASVRQGTPSGLDALRLRIPLVGTVIRCAIGARLTRVLGVLLKSGVPLIRALEVSVPVAGSSHFASALDGIARALRRGDALRAPLEACGLFDPLVVALVGAGEETGTVDAMLLAAAGYLDVELEAALSALAASIEPALIGVLGVVVGVIVFSIFLPLYTLIGSIQ